MGGSAVHESVGHYGGRVLDQHSHGVLGVLQDEVIREIISDQKLEVKVDWLVSG